MAAPEKASAKPITVARREYQRRYYTANRDKRLAQMRSLALARYGIDAEQYESMLAAQSGGCAICGATQGWKHGESGKPKRLAVDHDHETGEVRGLLCDRCNTGIGKFGSPDILRLAANYMEHSIHSGT